MSARTAAVLERFPLHLSATDPGKRIGATVDALAAELDVLTRQLGDVRVAHRVREAGRFVEEVSTVKEGWARGGMAPLAA